MRKREATLFGCVAVIIALLLMYVPILVAWASRTNEPPMVRIGPPEPWRRFIGVEMNWCMRLLSGIYRPALRLHARWHGYDPLPHVGGVDDDASRMVIFEKRGTYEAFQQGK